jgi:hypothetical protein
MTNPVFPCKDCILLPVCINIESNTIYIECKKLYEFLKSNCTDSKCIVRYYKEHNMSYGEVPCVKYGKKYFGRRFCYFPSRKYMVIRIE